MMKSVGEVMAMGRTWQESMQKAMRGMETGHDGWDLPNRYKTLPREELMYKLRVPNPDRFIILHQVGVCAVYCFLPAARLVSEIPNTIVCAGLESVTLLRKQSSMSWSGNAYTDGDPTLWLL